MLDTSNFSFFLQCFENASFPDMSEGVIVLEWVKAGQSLTRIVKGENVSYPRVHIFDRTESIVGKIRNLIISTLNSLPHNPEF